MKSHLLLAGLFAPFLAASAASVIIEAGAFDRRQTMVTFRWPSEISVPMSLRDEAGRVVPLQVRGEEAALIAPELKRGQRLVCSFADSTVEPKVTATKDSRSVTLSAFGKTAFMYHTAESELPAGRNDLKPIFRRAGYLHPVFSPSGLVVTDDYPPNHKHHHGIWLSWSKAEFEGRVNDYWNMGEGKGRMDFRGLDETWSGPVHAGFKSRHAHIDMTSGEPKAALNETWDVRLYAVDALGGKPCFVFDVDVTDTCATAAPVKLPEYRYGGICVRGNWAWNGKTNAFVLTSEGETDRNKGDKGQVKARWIHMGGFLNGQFTGIAGFDHPSNVNFPEPVRLNAAEPYFNFTAQQAGEVEITPAKPWTGKYRFVVADGKPNQADLERMWNDYAHPPVVRVQP